ncbi:hypothetical protein F511_13462 [Dorcoceras hygrometricum]|uniref:Uncharacterized protein n=1 Tax=Dorcoceras hygrometricum TaxID=472368 RepID=A0A2Z7AD53_9LAMI|nr:hypothetical protein F511_13462 [Dorcoceras hygrometricum]
MANLVILFSSSSTQIHHHCCPFDATSNLCKLRTRSLNRRISLVRASSRGGEEETRGSPFISQEDLKYVAKLGGGSLVGAAAVKYGSIVFPEITRPNIGRELCS